MNPSQQLFLFLVFLFTCIPAAVGRQSIFRGLVDFEDDLTFRPFINEVVAMPNDADKLSNGHRIIVSHFFLLNLISFVHNLYSSPTKTETKLS
jgi:hypothetical protein